jgi:hypothetical protein
MLLKIKGGFVVSEAYKATRKATQKATRKAKRKVPWV